MPPDAVEKLRGAIRDVPDFPKPGIIFKDITPVLCDGALFRTSIDLFRERCRGLQIGDAQVSEKHCNFLLNLGAARAAEIEELGEEVRRRVKEHSGVELEWEIQRVGVAA